MPRRAKPERRELPPDPKFRSVLVTKFISSLMKRGKRSVAESIFYRAVGLAEAKSGQKGIEVFTQGVENVKPIVEVKSRRVGGATYQVPIEVRQDRRLTLAIKWIIQYSHERSEKTMAEQLAGEFIAASRSEGNAIKRREDTHRMAEANRAFAHYRW